MLEKAKQRPIETIEEKPKALLAADIVAQPLDDGFDRLALPVHRLTVLPPVAKELESSPEERGRGVHLHRLPIGGGDPDRLTDQLDLRLPQGFILGQPGGIVA